MEWRCGARVREKLKMSLYIYIYIYIGYYGQFKI